ncbi:hypothetical protein LWI28_028334 [Acer negundo]|uniref:Uncharacterized protein n=1 Tax=Acer negundo TaxID=4023 RepID=A0AAD5J2U9_ACENE|nr:hypothetical protein LWI28_028334 [Acer negundo]KAK4849244.1 hypothetical protein QYF36_022708 [Acer negundo]
MSRARGGRVTFDPQRVVLAGGANGADDLITFCIADPGDAFLNFRAFKNCCFICMILEVLNGVESLRHLNQWSCTSATAKNMRLEHCRQNYASMLVLVGVE